MFRRVARAGGCTGRRAPLPGVYRGAAEPGGAALASRGLAACAPVGAHGRGCRPGLRHLGWTAAAAARIRAGRAGASGVDRGVGRQSDHARRRSGRLAWCDGRGFGVGSPPCRLPGGRAPRVAGARRAVRFRPRGRVADRHRRRARRGTVRGARHDRRGTTDRCSQFQRYRRGRVAADRSTGCRIAHGSQRRRPAGPGGPGRGGRGARRPADRNARGRRVGGDPGVDRQDPASARRSANTLRVRAGGSRCQNSQRRANRSPASGAALADRRRGRRRDAVGDHSAGGGGPRGWRRRAADGPLRIAGKDQQRRGADPRGR